MPEPAALTIPARCYSDRQYVFTENERLWRKAWLLVAATDQVAEPGDFAETRFGLAPTMVIRGDDGRLRGFENVCQHQGAPLCLGSGGGLTEIECKNHRWAWDLAGRLKAVDFGQPVGGGDQDIPLQPLVLETWGPFVFATFDPAAPPLAESITTLAATLDAAGVDPDGLRCRSVVSTLVGGNWKSLLDGATAIGDVPDLGVRQYPDLAVRVDDGVVSIVRARPYVSIDRAQFDVLVFEPRPAGDDGTGERHRPLEVTLKGDAELPSETGVDPALIEFARRQVGAVPPTEDLTADAGTPELLALHTWLDAFGVTAD